MTDSDSDIEIKSKLTKKFGKTPKSPSDDLNKIEVKKITTKGMITDALKQLKSRKGVSLHAIKKHLNEKYEVNTEKLNYVIKKSIKAGVEDGTFVQLKGKGASGSFKLANVKDPVKKPKKKMVSEKIAKDTKDTKKPVASKKTTEKEDKPEIKAKAKTEESKTKKQEVEVKVTKKGKEKVNKVEDNGKKSKAKMAIGKMSPTKKRAIMMKRKSIGSIIKPPKMKPKHK